MLKRDNMTSISYVLTAILFLSCAVTVTCQDKIDPMANSSSMDTPDVVSTQVSFVELDQDTANTSTHTDGMDSSSSMDTGGLLMLDPMANSSSMDTPDVVSTQVSFDELDQDTANASTHTDVMNSTQPTVTVVTSTATDATVPPQFQGEQIPPSITSPASSANVIVFDNDTTNFEIQCKATGNPKPEYQWYQGGIQIDDSSDYVKAYRNGILFFPKFSNRESGWYQCKATNQFGTSVSNVFYLVKETSQFKVKEESKQETRIEWEPYSVQCSDLPPMYPKIRVRWYDVNHNQIREDERIGQDDMGTLHLAYVTKEEDGSVFSCAAVNSLTSTILVTKISTLSVTAAEEVNKLPTVQYSSDYVEATIGKDVTLDCFIAGKPISVITWKNSSHHDIKPRQDPRFEIYDYGRKMKVKKVNVNDEGTFSCRGANVGGSVDATIVFNVTSPPLLVPGSSLISQTVPDQHDVTLKCQGKSAPLEFHDNPVWFRNGMPLTQVNVPDQNRYKFSSDLTSLTITQLDKEKDIACFQCNITNSRGFLYFDAYLRVIDAIQIQRKPEKVILIEEDSVVDLTILAKGDVCCQINTLWYFNGTEIGDYMLSQPPFQLDRQSKSLKFDAGSVSRETLYTMLGTYRCRVSNLYQHIDIDIEIILKNDKTIPEPVIKSADTMGLWWIGLVCGLVAVMIAVVIVLFFVYKRKNPGATYKLEKQELRHNLNPEEDLLNQSFHEI